nr:LuxR family transcriptional regulator [Propionicimonas sp.]
MVLYSLPALASGGAGLAEHEERYLQDVARLWESLDADRFRFAQDALGGRLPNLDWDGVVSWALDAEVAEWSGGALLLKHSLVTDGRRQVSPQTAYTARTLLDRWLFDPDPSLLVDALRWCVLLEAWDVLADLWAEQVAATPAGAMASTRALFAELPEEARRQSPILTCGWAWGQAGPVTSPEAERRFLNCLLSDGLSIHAYWRGAERTDAGVIAGSLWMTAQRLMPTSDAASTLDQAWATQNEIAEYIAQQRGRGRAPSSTSEAIFRASSARLALARSDLDKAIAEAGYAMAIDPAGELIAGGTKALAMELSGYGDGSVPQAAPFALACTPISHGCVGQDAASAAIARAHAALRTVDRELGAEAIAAMGEIRIGSTPWTSWIYVQALYAALWGDPGRALPKLDAMVAKCSVNSVEQYEPLGRALLRRGRIFLLDRLGASAAAIKSAKTIPGAWRYVPLAGSLLWAGDFEEAERTTRAGIFDPDTRMADRIMLQVVRAAAKVMLGTDPPELCRALANEAVDACLDGRLIALAILPTNVRHELVRCYSAPDGTSGAAALGEDVVRKLDGVVVGDSGRKSMIRLTKREQQLLPLLASADTVPDIAAALHVSANTIRKQVVGLRGKFEARTRAELIRKARDADLLH